MPTGVVVNPGSIHAYHFDVTPEDGPTKYDEDCLTNMYQSAVDLSKDIYSGLFGPMLICRPGTLTVDGKQVETYRFYSRLWHKSVLSTPVDHVFV